ncbi:MAG TPA: GAF domain-containing protein, partial [Polyangiales bacterium]
MEQPDLLKVLESPERLRVLLETELLDSEAEEVFDRLTRLAARLLDAPTAVVSLIDAKRQFLKSSHGLGGVPGAERNTPLTHSFCKYTVATNQPLVVENAPEHPLVRDNLAVSEYGVRAYAGVPIGAGDQPLGALCVVDQKPRAWSSDQVQLLRDLARAASAEIELRLALKRLRVRDAMVRAFTASTSDAIVTADREGNIVFWNPAAEEMFGWARADVLGRELAETIIPPAARAAHRAGLARYLATSETSL